MFLSTRDIFAFTNETARERERENTNEKIPPGKQK